jgi:hypothetical protein
MLNDISPSHESLGTVNAIALTLFAGIRAVVPGSFTSLFAVGVKNQFLSGYLIWLILIVGALLLSVILQFTPAKAEGKPIRAERDD